MVEVEECINLCDRKGPLKLKGKFYKMSELPYNEDDEVIKAIYFEVFSTLRDVVKISSVWRENTTTYSKKKEKIIAARRSEVMTIIFPAANRRVFDELSDNVKEGLDVHFVDDYNQIFELAFGRIDSSES
ncbi:hypothetical protein M5K25_013804 [Dendrobium thyrsiflorum]|uniref:Lon proteolytic domain-containing protein n=1 Tax=Dendrobium thyrsiflorum TaxID=117978 RepID=A0ABD0UUH7_DENTH